jgi:uncharacterized protein (DUF2141 family)
VSQEPERVNDATDTVKQRIASIERGDVSWKSYSDQWNENHGTLLMGFASIIFLIGVGVLAYQQNRFRPVAFPSASAIEPRTSTDVDELLASDTDPTSDDADTIRLQVSGGSNAGGLVRIAAYSSADHFNKPEEATWKKTVPVDEQGGAECLIPLSGLPTSFAIAVYQDSNDNNQLDRSALGIPSERYGFSNAARSKLGPPPFADAEVQRPAPGESLEIEIW